MIKKYYKHHNKKGSLLVIALIAIFVGLAISASLLKYSSFNNILVEKEVGNVKCAQAIKLSNRLYLTTIQNTPAINDSEIADLQKRIGGGSTNPKSIFGYASGNSPSNIPGFRQINVDFKGFNYIRGTVLQTPSDGSGFNFFEDTMGQETQALLNDTIVSDVPAFLQNTKAVVNETDKLEVVPVFNMLAFYDRDLEFFAEEQGGFFSGRIHTNGNLYLVNLNKISGTEMTFHGRLGASLLSAHGNVFRRGRGGLESTFWPADGNSGSGVNTDAHMGLEFYIYDNANYANILNVNDFNVNKPTGSSAQRVLTPDYTTYVHNAVIQNASYSPHINEANARRHAGNHEDFGCRFTQVSKAPANSGNPFTLNDANGDPYGIIIADAGKLAPPVTINPYQYIEDIQYSDIPDTINYAAPIPSNYTEDAAADNVIADNAFNSIAALVIRDGVVYERTTPGGNLTRVLSPLAYPDPTHPDAKQYADLRWYGWFGMYDGVNPSPDNPARWHFPIKSVTFNKTVSGSTEGSPVPFTFRTATVHNPVTDGVSSGTASWIRTDIDLFQLNGYPGSNQNNATDNTGTGVGMWNNSYPVLRGGIERYDPVRVAYNAVKAEVRKLYNQNHIYTSRYGVVGGVYKMLNKNGGDPGNNIAPDVWGSDVDKMQDNFGVDYDNADGDLNSDTGRDYSAFWNDDGAIGPIGAHRYWRINVLDNGGGNHIRITEMGFVTSTGTILPTSSLGNFDITESSKQNNNMDGAEAFDGEITPSDGWQSAPNLTSGWVKVGGKTSTDLINPVAITMTMETNAANGVQNAPKDFDIEYSDDNATWISIAEIRGQTWTPNSMMTISINQPRAYKYIRDPDNENTYPLWGHLTTSNGPIDTTPKVELFPIRHTSLVDIATNPTSFYEDINTYNPPTTRPPQANCIDSNRNNDWYIYKSTLPLSNRTLPMPLNRAFLIGYDEVNNRPLSSTSFISNWYNGDALSIQAHNRIRNFGYVAHLDISGVLKENDGEHNWYTLLNNAPEMLVRQRTITHEVPDTTISTSGGAGFSYMAGDCGGYYGNDNLCMIDNQEKKIVVFTELDLAEFTKECFVFNNLATNFATNNVSIREKNQLQNVVYIVNTTMGNNFYGKRVHCGAVRLKRGAVLQFPLSIASPNSVYVWGDYNAPGYFHHGPKQTDVNVGNIISYNVPTFREHDTSTTISSQPAAIYADAIQIIENNWIPFNQTDVNRRYITQANNGALNSSNINWHLGYTNAQLEASKIWPSNPGGHDFQNSGANVRTYLDFTRGTHFDHELWWEDDGLRIIGGAPNANGSGTGEFNTGMSNVYLDSKASPIGNRSRGTQLYINYHSLHFNIPGQGGYTHLNSNILQRYAGGGNPIMKIMPQAIVGGFFYGNVEGRSPSVFNQTDVSAISLTKPSSITQLDWLTSWIHRTKWVELSRNLLMDISQDCSTVGNGSISAVEAPAGAFIPSNLTTGNFYGFDANSYVEDRFELLKKRFGNIGFKLDIRSMHTYHWPVFPDWANFGGIERQNYTRNFIGAFSCLFDSRQATHEQREKDNSWEGRSMYCFNPDFENPDGLPPGTPLVTNLGSSKRTIGGTKWNY